MPRKKYFNETPEQRKARRHAYNVKYHAENRAVITARQREWSRKNPRDRKLSLRAWREKRASRPRPQHCEACGLSESLTRNKVLCFDHDHKTGAFRGWLCDFCNCALGYAQDNVERLRLLASYLERS
jgi:hypothetical protein